MMMNQMQLRQLIKCEKNKGRIDSDKHNNNSKIQDMVGRIKEEFRLIIVSCVNLFETEFTTKFDENGFFSVLLIENCYKEIEELENDSIQKVLENIESLSKVNHTENSCGYKISKAKLYLKNLIGASDNYKLIFGLDGKSTIILTPEFIENSEKKIKCFVKQYGGQKECVSKLNVNGTLRLSENIADNGELKIAHRAYTKYLHCIGGEESKVPGFEKFNNELLFFISFGRTFCEYKSKENFKDQIKTDSHTPAEIRISVALTN
uniref:Phosphate-regulating neutral endopeptidase (inferred by orthology to a human protein) n=1 Tax=Strongyloides venezuelensis TaxID=75913 RepID=A0A0K0FEN7_STRVS